MKFLNSPSSGPNYPPAGCLPAILRRLLCFHALPTFPLDNRIQNSYEFEEDNKPKTKGDPGIVGKLMGLDSMPAVDNWKKGAFVELENEKFIILSFEGYDGKKGVSRNQKGKLSKKSTTDSHSENSSPVSVLQFSASFSGNDDSHSKNLNSRRKLRGDLDKNAPSSSSSTSSCNSVEDCEECVGFETKKSKEMWDEICEMAERDVMQTWKAEDGFGEIGLCLEMHILDHLILELFTIT